VSDSGNHKLYTHEFIDIIGQNRARYMHHMTANWSPIAQEERDQLCFGVWGVVGTTGRWPEVVNLWEEDGFDGLAAGLRHELSRPNLQDEKLEKWWAEASGYRRGGLDRLLIPAPWTRTITQLCEDGVSGVAYAHETVKLAQGDAEQFLSLVGEHAVPAYAEHGWELVGAWRTAMHDDAECMLIWAIPSWEQWADLEKAVAYRGGLTGWRDLLYERSTSVERFLMMDAPLCPLKIGRQPARSDRDPTWQE
jgi:hypothetical protein